MHLLKFNELCEKLSLYIAIVNFGSNLKIKIECVLTKLEFKVLNREKSETLKGRKLQVSSA